METKVGVGVVSPILNSLVLDKTIFTQFPLKSSCLCQTSLKGPLQFQTVSHGCVRETRCVRQGDRENEISRCHAPKVSFGFKKKDLKQTRRIWKEALFLRTTVRGRWPDVSGQGLIPNPPESRQAELFKEGSSPEQQKDGTGEGVLALKRWPEGQVGSEGTLIWKVLLNCVLVASTRTDLLISMSELFLLAFPQTALKTLDRQRREQLLEGWKHFLQGAVQVWPDNRQVPQHLTPRRKEGAQSQGPSRRSRNSFWVKLHPQPWATRWEAWRLDVSPQLGGVFRFWEVKLWWWFTSPHRGTPVSARCLLPKPIQNMPEVEQKWVFLDLFPKGRTLTCWNTWRNSLGLGLCWTILGRV